MTPGYDSDWWGRDPIEEAGEDPRYVETDMGEGAEMSEGFDIDAVSKRLSGLEFDCRVALDRFMEASPWLTRNLLEDYMEKLGSSPRRFPSVHRHSA
jgi:hypothetical protein